MLKAYPLLGEVLQVLSLMRQVFRVPDYTGGFKSRPLLLLRLVPIVFALSVPFFYMPVP